MRLIDADALKEELAYKSPATDFGIDGVILGVIDEQPTASPWHRVEEPPKENGAYAVGWFYNGTSFWERCHFLDGDWLLDNGYPKPDYWMPVEPPKEDA